MYYSIGDIMHIPCFLTHRGENGPGCWVMQPLSDDCCRFQWLLDTNLRGWIPKSIIDSALSATQLEYMRHLRKHTEDLKARGKLREFELREAAAKEGAMGAAAAAAAVATTAALIA